MKSNEMKRTNRKEEKTTSKGRLLVNGLSPPIHFYRFGSGGGGNASCIVWWQTQFSSIVWPACHLGAQTKTMLKPNQVKPTQTNACQC